MDPTDIKMSDDATTGQRSYGSLLGYAFALAGAVWVFHDLNLREVWQKMTIEHWGWIVLAVACDIATYVCQGIRWVLLVTPLGRLRVIKATQAIYAGLFTNEVLPMRAGELVRGYLVAKWLPARFASVLPSLLVERLLDGLWTAIAIGIAILAVKLPPNLKDAGYIFGIVILVLTAVFVFIVWREEETGQDPFGTQIKSKLLLKFMLTLRHVADGLRQIGLGRIFYSALGMTGVMIILQVLAFWFVMLGYGLHISIASGAVVYLLMRIGTAIPNAPANVGSYQFFTVLGLTLLGFDKTVATGFALVVFFVLTVPLWALGLIAVGRSGTSLSAIRKDFQKVVTGKKTASGAV